LAPLDGPARPLYRRVPRKARRRPADSRQFRRRAYLDIWGLLPTPEETRWFVASTRPTKRNKLVASLLDNPIRYSEHWVSYWNDLLRNDQGVAYIAEIAQRKSITPWLLDALEKNKPYNQMVRELLNPTAASDPEGSSPQIVSLTGTGQPSSGPT
jgi:hypothetical protein